MSRVQDLIGCFRGIQLIVDAGFKLETAAAKEIMRNSSLRHVGSRCLLKKSTIFETKFNEQNVNIFKTMSESGDRLYTVADGVREFVTFSIKDNPQKPPQVDVKFSNPNVQKVDFEIQLTEQEIELLKRLDMEHRAKLKVGTDVDKEMDAKKGNEAKIENEAKKEKEVKVKVEKPKVSTRKHKDSLPSTSKERSVPASRIGRMISFGSLAAGLGIGTATEYAKRAVGLANAKDSNLFLSKANMDRIVDTLCKVRGAALKLGQLISIQDDSVISPELSEALQRVRKAADFMPLWQLEQVMAIQLGNDWRDKFSEFNEKPFAAASIGQVHWGRTIDGQDVAIKVQYPGVAKGINSDIDNLVGIMNMWNIFPKGMFIDNVIVVAKRELAWEVDYVREAQCTIKFRELLKPYDDYYVPKVLGHLCTPEIFTSEFVEGSPLEQCFDLPLEERSYIGTRLMELVLLELMEFKYMQTDPNWANFLYNKKTKKIILLDFGASREYAKEFIDKYVQIIKAASENDRQSVLEYSRALGMLTGYETKVMEEAHVDAVLILGEIFQHSGGYSFKGRDTIRRIQALVPTMIDHRLCPPPEEIYSLHRKLSGIFLLCAKLDAPIHARDLFLNMYDNYKFND